MPPDSSSASSSPQKDASQPISVPPVLDLSALQPQQLQAGPSGSSYITIATTISGDAAQNPLATDGSDAMDEDNDQPTINDAISAPPSVPEESITLVMKWSGKSYELQLSSSDLCVLLRLVVFPSFLSSPTFPSFP